MVGGLRSLFHVTRIIIEKMIQLLRLEVLSIIRIWNATNRIRVYMFTGISSKHYIDKKYILLIDLIIILIFLVNLPIIKEGRKNKKSTYIGTFKTTQTV